MSDVRQLLRRLEPRPLNSLESEPIEAYLPRVRALLPNFPDDAISQWLFQHYEDAVDRYGWLDFASLDFSLQTWPTDRLIRTVHSWPKGNYIRRWATFLRQSADLQDSSLGAAMIRGGTWPVPPLILHNEDGLSLPNGLPLGNPYHLVEGHHRLG